MAHLYVFLKWEDVGTLDSGEWSLPFGLLVCKCFIGSLERKWILENFVQVFILLWKSYEKKMALKFFFFLIFYASRKKCFYPRMFVIHGITRKQRNQKVLMFLGCTNRCKICQVESIHKNSQVLGWGKIWSLFTRGLTVVPFIFPNPDSFSKINVSDKQQIKHMQKHLSRLMSKPTKWPVRPAMTTLPVRPAKTPISLGIRPVWSESSLTAWRKFRSFYLSYL